MNPEISRVITILRFPLIVGVVFIHNDISPDGIENSQLAIFSLIKLLFTRVLPVFCVPMFFIIAGYLFFAKCEKASVQFFAKQYKKRFKSLVIPYVFWNTVVIAIFWALHKFAPTLINPDFENVANYPPPQLLNCFWKGSGGYPIAYQFWFVRELIVSVALSPIVYLFLAKRKNKLLNIFAGVLMGIYTIAYLTQEKTYIPIQYFFALGAFFALHKLDFVLWSKRLFGYALPLAIAICCLKLANYDIKVLDGIYVYSACIVSIAIASYFKSAQMSKPAESSFFIYAYHGIFILLVDKSITSLLHCKNEFLWCVIFFVLPSLIIVTGYCIYNILSRLLPRFTAIITGGRC